MPEKNIELESITWAESKLTWLAIWENMAYGDGAFVVVPDDQNSKANYSTDGGATWEESSTAGVSFLTGITYGEGAFIAVSTYRAAKSTDGGKTWSQITLPDGTRWKDIAYGDDVFVIVSGLNENKSAYSTDKGETWTESQLPIKASEYCIAYGGGVFVSMAYGAEKAAYSADGGKTWHEATVPYKYFVSVAYGDGVFVAVGGSKAAYSTDFGKTWVETQVPSSVGSLNGIAFGSGAFLIVGEKSATAAFSVDGGKTWVETPLPISERWYGVAYGDGVFVVTAGYASKNNAIYGRCNTIVKPTLKKIWTIHDIPTPPDMEAYLAYIRAAMDIFPNTEFPPLPENMNNLTFEGANNIERVLLKVGELVAEIQKNRSRIYSGELQSGGF